jgi:hypothetical protein
VIATASTANLADSLNRLGGRDVPVAFVAGSIAVASRHAINFPLTSPLTGLGPPVLVPQVPVTRPTAGHGEGT